MKNIYETILNHKSIRKYKEEDISKEDLHKLLNSVLHAPTSINGQQCSVIVIRDKNKKEQLAELTGGQEWVAKAPVFLIFVMDFARAAKAMERQNVEIKITESVEATLVGAVDCGIAFGSMMNLAEAMGYGIVPIGAIRKEPEKVIEMLNLPKYVYPVVGMCVGIPDEEAEVKPRFEFDTIIHEEEYKPISDEEIDRYDEIIKEYMTEKTNGQDTRNWTEVMNTFYSYIYFKEVKSTLEKQGFENKK